MERAIAALEHVKNAGMDPYLNITVGHYNANATSRNFWIIQNKKDTKHCSMWRYLLECGKMLKILFVMIKIENI